MTSRTLGLSASQRVVSHAKPGMFNIRTRTNTHPGITRPCDSLRTFAATQDFLALSRGVLPPMSRHAGSTVTLLNVVSLYDTILWQIKAAEELKVLFLGLKNYSISSLYPARYTSVYIVFNGDVSNDRLTSCPEGDKNHLSDNSTAQNFKSN